MTEQAHWSHALTYDPRTHAALTFHDARARFAERRDTPRDYLERCLDVIGRREGELKGWVVLNEVGARTAADASAQRYRDGRPLSAIDGITAALATLRSRGVTILGVIQSMAQLDAIYSPEQRKVIADNCRYKFVLSATDPETQKYFSDLAGQRTVVSLSQSKGDLSIVGSRSQTEAAVPLIRPEEWAHLAQPVLLAPKLNPAQLSFVFWDMVSL